MAGPLAPPFTIASRESSRRSASWASGPWHLTHDSKSSGRTEVSKNSSSACEWLAGDSLAVSGRGAKQTHVTKSARVNQRIAERWEKGLGCCPSAKISGTLHRASVPAPFVEKRLGVPADKGGQATVGTVFGRRFRLDSVIMPNQRRKSRQHHIAQQSAPLYINTNVASASCGQREGRMQRPVQSG